MITGKPYLEVLHPRHLQIEEHQVGPQFNDLLQDLGAILGLTYYGHFGQKIQFLPQDLPRDLFVVGDDGPDEAIHLKLVYYRTSQKRIKYWPAG